MVHTLDYICAKIEKHLQNLCYVENNLQYIKKLKALNFWFMELANNFADSTEYMIYFYNCGSGISTFSRVQNSILEYNYGNKPF